MRVALNRDRAAGMVYLSPAHPASREEPRRRDHLARRPSERRPPVPGGCSGHADRVLVAAPRALHRVLPRRPVGLSGRPPPPDAGAVLVRGLFRRPDFRVCRISDFPSRAPGVSEAGTIVSRAWYQPWFGSDTAPKTVSRASGRQNV